MQAPVGLVDSFPGHRLFDVYVIHDGVEDDSEDISSHSMCCSFLRRRWRSH